MSNLAALGRMSLTIGASCTGTMPKLAERLGENQVAGLIDSTLRGVGMAGFANNPLSGLLFVIASLTISPWVAFVLLVAAVASTATAVALGLDAHDIRAGLYGYNGALVGGSLSVFLEPNWSGAVLCFAIVTASFSTIVMAALIHVMARTWGVPPVALPFNIVLLMFLLASQGMKNGHLGAIAGSAADSHSPDLSPGNAGNIAGIGDLFSATVKGVGQVIFADTFVASALVLTSILICRWQNAILAVAGSATATFVAIVVGLSESKIQMGLYGLNGFLVCVAIGGIFIPRRTPLSVALGIVGAGASAIAAAALDNVAGVLGLPGSITLAYCMITALIVGVKFLSIRLEPQPQPKA
ncbi:urea transporter [Nocardia testacea]|uniref:urea transporter n=1 Tax=Nocardia testacea TaxID=248551 RepID=UPI003411DFE1